MKIAIISDLHFGSRNANQAFHDYFFSFYKDQLFPYMKEHGIKELILGGDTVEHRKYINFYIANRVRKEFYEPLQDMNVNINTIIGNHDLYYRASSDIDAITEMFGGYKNQTIHQSFSTVDYDGFCIDMIPWIHNGNYKETLQDISKSNSSMAIGHLELKGFRMYKGLALSEDGLDASLLKKYDLVLSGHFHHRSSKNNVQYLGTPYQITWSDYDDPKGFHVFDTETRELQFIQNQNNLFVAYHYHEDVDKLKNLDYSMFTDKMIKIFVQNKNDQRLLDGFLNLVNKAQPLSVIVSDNVILQNESQNLDDVEDTITVIERYIDALSETNDNKGSLKKYMRNLYQQALEVSVSE